MTSRVSSSAGPINNSSQVECSQDDNPSTDDNLDGDDKGIVQPLLLNTTTSKRKSSGNNRHKKKIQSSNSNPSLHKRLINRRSFLLALSLTLILLVFWLLDSLKDPTFAILVNGNLKRHQPLAKMASVGGTLVLVVIMEIITYYKGQRRFEEKKKADEEVLSGGGIWTKMDIDSRTNEDTNYGGEDASPGQIPISTFRTVGIAYICAFLFIAHLLSFHPDLQKRGPTSDDTEVNPRSGVEKDSVLWYILGYVQYMIIESYGSISVATFWSFVNSTLSLKAAKVYYGFIIAMAQIGAIGGSTIATFQHISKPTLVMVACIGIMMQIGVMHVYGNNFPHAMVDSDDAVFDDAHDNDYETELEAKAQLARRKQKRNTLAAQMARSDDQSTKPETFVSGFHLVLKHDYLLLILGVSCLYEISLTCLDYQMKLIGLDRFSSPEFGNDVTSPEEMGDRTGASFAVFMGRYGQLTNLLSLGLSYFVFPYLMEHYGLSVTLRIFPFSLFIINLIAFIALPMNLSLLFVSMSLLKALTYSINDPAKEILYIPTGNVVKFKAKFWIDIVGARIAKAIGSSINTYAGTAERVIKYGSIPSILSAVALGIICFAAGLKFDSLLEKGEIVGIDEDEKLDQAGLLSYYDDDEANDKNVEVTCSDDFIDNPSDTDWDSSVSIELVRDKPPLRCTL